MMKLISIEPTPSPNTMKLNLDESLPKGVKRTFTAKDKTSAPVLFQKILDVPGVVSIFHTADFIAVDRSPKGDWQSILSQIRAILGGSADSEGVSAVDPMQDAFGEAHVFVQVFRSIPMQVRVRAGTEEVRRSLPERFVNAAIQAGNASPNLIKERKLEEYGIRYGELEEIADQVVQELDASYTEERLSELVKAAEAAGADASAAASPEPLKEITLEEAKRLLKDEDWKKRYAALQRIKPSKETLPLLAMALEDPQPAIRRLACVYIGDVGAPDALPYLFQALRDSSVQVRRTAGDTLSDLGDPAAIGPMAEALRDKNKLVRWRAARFLYEAGDETALPALREAADDPEFEVRMQVKMAIERIEGGEAAEGSVWQQMTRRNES